MTTALKIVPREEKLISVDSHVLYTDEWVMSRLPERLRARWTQAVGDMHATRAKKMRGFTPNINDLMDMEAWDDPGHTDPAAKIKAMDRDGVFAEVIFPEVSASRVCTPQNVGADWADMLSGFNDAVGDFAATNPDRLLCAYQIMPYDIQWALKEVDRVLAKGARCVQIPAYPADYGMKDYYHDEYRPLLAKIQEAGLVVLQHLDTKEDYYDILNRDPTPMRGIAMGMPAMQMQEVFAFWLLPGVMEDFPKLKVIFVEPGLGWLPFLFETILDGRIKQGHYDFPKLKMLPSEYFKRQMGATFMYEPYGLKIANEYFGPDVLYWSTDFPHPATSWPNSRALIETQFGEAGISGEDRYKILCGNGMRTFGFA
jgi:predicted TIM-barrel fold metal-dependent hydrolase